jgi:histidinol-phosphate aminotransferase
MRTEDTQPKADEKMVDIFALARSEILEARPYVPGKPIEEARRELNLKGRIVKLASNENPYPPAEPIRRALIEAIEEVNRYPDSGSFVLVRELAAFHRTEPGRVFVGNGSNEVLDLLVRAFVKPGEEEVVFPHPSFIVYEPICQINAAGKIAVPLRNDRLDLDAMADAVGPRTKMVFVCNPNNPTATYVSDEEVRAFMARIPENVLVVFDEAYYEFVTAEDYPDTLGQYADRPTVIVLRTFSKVHGLAGIRLGYGLAHPDVVTCLHKVRQPFHVNSLAQAAAIAAVRNPEASRERLRTLIAERERLHAALTELGCRVPSSQTNFFLVRPGGGGPDLVHELLERGIIVRGMERFGYDPQVFRLNVGTPEENDLFLEAYRELAG